MPLNFDVIHLVRDLRSTPVLITSSWIVRVPTIGPPAKGALRHRRARPGWTARTPGKSLYGSARPPKLFEREDVARRNAPLGQTAWCGAAWTAAELAPVTAASRTGKKGSNRWNGYRSSASPLIVGRRTRGLRTPPARPAPSPAIGIAVTGIEAASRSSFSVPALYNQAVERTGAAAEHRYGRAERRFCAPFARRGTRAGRSPLR